MQIIENFSQFFKIMLKTGHIPEKFYDALGFSKDEVSGVVYDRNDGIEREWMQRCCSSPRWENLPSGHQWYPLKGLSLGYMYWGQKHSSE